MADPVTLLRSLDPEQRKRGVKMVAQMKDETALRVLLKVHKDDKDPAVRELAKKGAQYVVTKLEEQGVDLTKATAMVDEAAAEAEDDYYEEEEEVAAPVHREVSERDAQRAKGYIEAAMNYHMSDDKKKAMQSLSRALQVNPNLHKDNYFKSVASSITGLSDLEAVNAIANEDKRKGLASAVDQANTEAASEAHMTTAKKHTWGTISIDLVTLSVIVLVGTILAVLVINQGAGIEAARVSAELNPVVEEGAEPPPELTAEEQDDLEERLITAQTTQSIFTLGTALSMGIGFWLAMIIGLVVFAAIVHMVARAMQGEGTLPYLIYNLIAAHNIPMVVMFIVIILGAVLVYLVGAPGGVIWLGVAGIAGLINFIIALRVVGRISKAYRFGIGKALGAALVGSFGYGLISGGIIFVLSLIIGGVFAAFSGLAVPPGA